MTKKYLLVQYLEEQIIVTNYRQYGISVDTFIGDDIASSDSNFLTQLHTNRSFYFDIRTVLKEYDTLEEAMQDNFETFL